MKRWLRRIFARNTPQTWGFAITDGKRIEFDEPLTTWQAVARINAEK